MVHDYSRNTFPRSHWTGGDGIPTEQPAEENRYHGMSGMRRPPISIDKALREQCNIPAKSYFVAVVLDDDSTAYFAGPSSVPEQEIPNFFNMPRYLRYLKRQGSGPATSQYEEPGFSFENDYHRQPAGPHYPSRRGYDRRRANQVGEVFDDEGFPYKTRKRPRAAVFRREAIDDDAPSPISSSKRGIEISHSDEVWKFYDQRFRNCQQTACKMIAKAWVKAVEPKKQSNHPYTGSDEKAPDWWPKPWGPTRDEKVRHKEPDHLYKNERVYLLNHILRMVLEPNAKQHPDIQKLNLNITKLEDVTMDALSSFFSDKENTNNAKKKPYLREIFKVAKFEERYKNGEIDGNTVVYVMADDKIPDNYQSEDDTPMAKDDNEHDPSTVPPSVSPQKTTAPQGLIAASSADHSQNASLQAPFMGDLPVRPAHYGGAPIVGTDLAQEQHPYVEGGGGLAVATQPPLQAHTTMTMPEICPNPHDASRRPSMFSSPTEFQSSSGPGIYANSWQSGTTAPSNTTMYSFTQQHQQHSNPTGFVQSPNVPIGHQGQQYLGTSFDSMPRGYDPNQAGLFRTGAVQQNPVSQQPQGYPGYVESRVPNAGLKIEPLPRRLH